MSNVYHLPENMLLLSFEEILDTLGILLVAVSIVISTEDKLYLSHKNSQNNEKSYK